MIPMVVLVIDDEHEIRMPWLRQQIEKFAAGQPYEVIARVEVPTYSEFIQIVPELICWDNDLGPGGETSNIVHNWLWNTSDDERDILEAVVTTSYHLIHSANPVRNQELRLKLIDMGAQPGHILVKSIAGDL